jgi:hypothetical protein
MNEETSGLLCWKPAAGSEGVMQGLLGVSHPDGRKVVEDGCPSRRQEMLTSRVDNVVNYLIRPGVSVKGPPSFSYYGTANSGNVGFLSSSVGTEGSGGYRGSLERIRATA